MKKREFIKYGFAGLGGVYLINPVRALGAILSKGNVMSDTNLKVEARYVIETPKGLRCLICPNECTLEEGELSDCKNRRVTGGKLYTLGYANPCAIHADPVEKKPFMHYYPGMNTLSFGTAGCTFNCLNCQNWEISQASPEDTRNIDASPENIVLTARENKYPAIAYTYTEPISFFEFMYDTAVLAKKEGIKNLMISNGYINPRPLKDLTPYIDAANIDLKVFDDEVYQQLTGGRLDPVLNTIKYLRENGVWVEVTNLIVPDWTDDMDTIKKMCKWMSSNNLEDTPLHFSRFHAAYKLKTLRSTPLKSLLQARDIALEEGIRYVYIGNVPEIEGENTYCHKCNTLLVKRQGYTILSNSIINGKCPECSAIIPGHWS
jgi:pyruvate formate lyase activating enzyme